MPMMQPYGRYTSPAGQIKTTVLIWGPLRIWYSNRRPIAFQVNNHRIVVRQNIWGRDTARHMNWIDGGRTGRRVDATGFQRSWDRQVEPLMREISNARTFRRERSRH